MNGIEFCLIKEFSGWDGEMDYMNFYNCTLHPQVYQELNLPNGTPVDVDMGISGFFNKGSICIFAVNSSEIIAKVTPILDGLTIKFEFELM